MVCKEPDKKTLAARSVAGALQGGFVAVAEGHVAFWDDFCGG